MKKTAHAATRAQPVTRQARGQLEHVMAACRNGHGLVLWASGPISEEWTTATTPPILGFPYSGLPRPTSDRAPGIWVWAGYPRAPGPSDSGVDWSDGAWRAPTADELVSLGEGVCPWETVFEYEPHEVTA